jgi:hypothetical protein
LEESNDALKKRVANLESSLKNLKENRDIASTHSKPDKANKNNLKEAYDDV